MSASPAPPTTGLPAWLRHGLVLAAAMGFTAAASMTPRSPVFPTLAFFTWAYLFAEAAVTLYREVGLVGRDDDGSEEESPSEEVYRIDE